MRRNIRLLEIQDIMMSAIFIVPVIVPYYRDEIGLTFQDFLIGQTFFAITVIALEVPSGWVSDIWKRKHVAVLSTVFWILGFLVLLMADNLFMAIASQVIMGIAISLLSGTNSAILYDTLLALGEEKRFIRLEGRRKGFGFYSVAAASLLGGFLYELHTQLPIILGIITASLGLLAAFFMVEPVRNKTTMHKNPLKDMLMTMRYALHGHSVVGMIIVFAATLFCATKLIMWVQQPYYMALRIPESMFGVLMAVGYLLGGLASHINHLIAKYLSNFKAIICAWSLGVLVCLGSAMAVGLHGIALLMIGGSFIYGASFPRVQDAINKCVGSERRATILSTANLLRELSFVPLALAVGWSVEHYGVSGGLYTIVVWLSLSGICLAAWAIKRTKE